MKSNLIFSFSIFASLLLSPLKLTAQNDTVTILADDIPITELSDSIEPSTVSMLKVAIVLSDIYGKKDMEFTKGFLLGMEKANLPSHSISLKIINGDITPDSLAYEFDMFVPDVIISTFEKGNPIGITEYSRLNNCKVVNAFDSKNDEYLYNPVAYQLLSPSSVFNTMICGYFTKNFPGNTLIIIGDPDPTDLMLREIILEWPEEDLLILEKDDLARFNFDEGVNYLIYTTSSSSQEIKSILTEILRLMSEEPSAGVRIIGRPNWAAFNDLNSLIANMEVFVPARCYFDASTSTGKNFISEYHSKYRHTPIKSFPVYSVMGYDIAHYFLPYFLSEAEGKQVAWSPARLIQSYYNIEKSESAGFFNKGAYMLHFEPWGTLDKEIIE